MTLTYLVDFFRVFSSSRNDFKKKKSSPQMAYFLYLSSVLIDVLFWNCSKQSSYSFMVSSHRNVPWRPRVLCLRGWGNCAYVTQQTAMKPMKYSSRKFVSSGCLSTFHPCLLPTNVNSLPLHLRNRWFCYKFVAKSLRLQKLDFFLEFSALSLSPCSPMKQGRCV